MKICCLLLLLALIPGCVSETTPPPDAKTAGAYSSEDGIDSWVTIELAADHTYTEWFAGGTVMVITAKNPTGEMPRQRVAAGRWTREGDNVILRAEVGHSRRLRLREINGRVFLEQPAPKGVYRFYRNQS
jgi:hypothetical protein